MIDVNWNGHIFQAWVGHFCAHFLSQHHYLRAHPLVWDPVSHHYRPREAHFIASGTRCSTWPRNLLIQSHNYIIQKLDRIEWSVESTTEAPAWKNPRAPSFRIQYTPPNQLLHDAISPIGKNHGSRYQEVGVTPLTMTPSDPGKIYGFLSPQLRALWVGSPGSLRKNIFIRVSSKSH